MKHAGESGFWVCDKVAHVSMMNASEEFYGYVVQIREHVSIAWDEVWIFESEVNYGDWEAVP